MDGSRNPAYDNWLAIWNAGHPGEQPPVADTTDKVVLLGYYENDGEPVDPIVTDQQEFETHHEEQLLSAEDKAKATKEQEDSVKNSFWAYLKSGPYIAIGVSLAAGGIAYVLVPVQRRDVAAAIAAAVAGVTFYSIFQLQEKILAIGTMASAKKMGDLEF
jgi:hypothetical protein